MKLYVPEYKMNEPYMIPHYSTTNVFSGIYEELIIQLSDSQRKFILDNAPKHKSRIAEQKWNIIVYCQNKMEDIEFKHFSITCFVDMFNKIPQNCQLYTNPYGVCNLL